MTAPADRARRLAGHGPACRARRGADGWGAARVDAEFAAIVAGQMRNRDADPGLPEVPPAERCDEAIDVTAELCGRIAGALFCTSGLDAQLITFAIRRVAEHCAVDEARVADQVAAEILRIAVSVGPGPAGVGR